jgi:hypothetical protein
MPFPPTLFAAFPLSFSFVMTFRGLRAAALLHREDAEGQTALEDR